MATTQDPRTSGVGVGRASREGPRRIRWTKKEFYRLAELGFFQDRHVELVGGELMQMTINPPHCVALGLTSDALRAAFGPGHYVRSQGVLDLAIRHQPQPDLAVVPGVPRDYASAHPTSALLVVEVSDTTIRYDRLVKAHLYARAGIADYWIVNIRDRQLEIFRNPGPDPSRRGRFAYADVTIVPATGTATPLAAPGVVIAAADLLP
jgi:Uma2 family endonuclease